MSSIAAASASGLGQKRKREKAEAESTRPPQDPTSLHNSNRLHKKSKPETADAVATDSRIASFDHDLSGAVAASAKLAESSSGEAPQYVDVLLKADGEAHPDQLRIYTFTRTLTEADLKLILKKALGGSPLTLLRKEKLPVDGDTGLQVVCHVVKMPSQAAVEKACETLTCAYPAMDGDSSALGLKGMLSALGTQKQDPRELQRAVDLFMGEFERAEGRAAEAKAQVVKAMDADGFTVVTSKGGFAPGGAAAGSSARTDNYESANQAKKKKRGTLIADDFYKFQRQENKMDRISDLRARFEEDRERIKKLKEARAFKPY